jgi:protocatechuate 3,4-dioxygenase beta subunit
VSDASGAAVPNATVTVTNKETGLRRNASTDDSGRFNFPQLKPGAPLLGIWVGSCNES